MVKCKLHVVRIQHVQSADPDNGERVVQQGQKQCAKGHKKKKRQNKKRKMYVLKENKKLKMQKKKKTFTRRSGHRLFSKLVIYTKTSEGSRGLCPGARRS